MPQQWSCDHGCGFASSNFKAVELHEEKCTAKLALEWLEDQGAIQKRLAKFDIEQRLKVGDGFAIIDDFLPQAVAEAALLLVQAASAHADWKSMSYGDISHEKDSVSHEFQFVAPEAVSGGEHVAEAVSLLFPDLLPVFTVAQYVRGNHIGSHDDKALVQVPDRKRKRTVVHSRKYACIYYLTKDWSNKLGGIFVDERTNKSYVPQFNRCVVFQVPRFHRVTQLTTDRPRYSVFGWWLVPGELYTVDHVVQTEQHEPVAASCSAIGCTAAAQSACPVCQEYDETLFCSQACFQKSWTVHKTKHKSMHKSSKSTTANRGALGSDSQPVVCRKKART